jgi:hypothetical protein
MQLVFDYNLTPVIIFVVNDLQIKQLLYYRTVLLAVIVVKRFPIEFNFIKPTIDTFGFELAAQFQISFLGPYFAAVVPQFIVRIAATIIHSAKLVITAFMFSRSELLFHQFFLFTPSLATIAFTLALVFPVRTFVCYQITFAFLAVFLPSFPELTLKTHFIFATVLSTLFLTVVLLLFTHSNLFPITIFHAKELK